MAAIDHEVIREAEKMSKGRNASFCERLKQNKIVVALGAHDLLCAKIFENAGFEALYMSGFANAAGMLGKPDVVNQDRKSVV